MEGLMEDLRGFLGASWFEIMQRNFPFIITEEDIVPFHRAYLIYKSGTHFPQYCERVAPVEKVRLGFDIAEVSKIFPNITTEDDLTRAFIENVENEYSLFFYKGYDVDYNLDTFKLIYKEYLMREGVKI